MGLYYFILLFLGIALLGIGVFWKGVSWSSKIVMLLFIIGSFCIVMAIVLFMPGSSEIIAQLLDWKN